MIAPAGPGAAVGCGEEGIDLGIGEPDDGAPVVPFGGDGEYALDRGGVFGMAERGVAEHGVDSSQPPVARADRVVSVVTKHTKAAAHTCPSIAAKTVSPCSA